MEVRREEILDAAAVEVARRGFAHTRVSDVADALGVSTALVFYHFGTKEHLFADTLEHAARKDLERLDKTVADARDPLDAVRRILDLYRPSGSAGGWTIWVDAWAEALREPTLRAMSRQLDVRWKDVLAAQIAAGVEQGMFDCADPEGAAWRLSALLDGLAVQVMVHRSITKKQLARWVRAATAAELGVEPKLLD